jgi:hypothetical protein
VILKKGETPVKTVKKRKWLKPNDREVVALAQFRTGAGPMDEKRKNVKRRRMEYKLEERRRGFDPHE